MSRYHGRAGRAYLSTSGTGNAAAVVALSQWSLSMAADRADATAFGDLNKRYTQGLPDVSGTLSGFWDDTDDTLYDAMKSSDGVKLYLYPSTNVATKYWYGPAWIDFSIETRVDGTVSVSGGFGSNGDWGQY